MRETAFLDMMTRREALARVGLLAGGALSAPLISGLLAGCRAAPPAAGFVPQTLDADQYELVSTLAELILPATDTPGARAAGVPAFIDEMLTTWYPEEDRQAMLTGLERLDERAEALFGTAFAEAGPAQQTALLEAMARQAFSASPPAEPEQFPGRPEVGEPQETDQPDLTDTLQEPLPSELPDLFRRLKELTVVGYYTSEVGATEELRVMPMGAYLSDIPYDEAGRAWS